MLNTIHQFFTACHPFGYPLLACSVILVTAILYRWYIRIRSIGSKATGNIIKNLTTGNVTKKLQHFEQLNKAQHTQTLPSIILYIVSHKHDADLPTVVESQLRCYIEKSRIGMSTISIITNIAPMLGILGTAWGLVDIFGVFGTPGAQEGIALGISKALYTTIFGLAIAVPGIIAQTCFERATEREAAELNEQFTYLLSHRNEL